MRIMINQFRFIMVLCLFVVLLGTPYALWSAANGKIIFAVMCAAADIAAFVGFVIARRTIAHIKQMEYRDVNDDVKPV